MFFEINTNTERPHRSAESARQAAWLESKSRSVPTHHRVNGFDSSAAALTKCATPAWKKATF